METSAYIKRLQEIHPLREPTLKEIINSLDLPEKSKGLDAGCGIGLPALILAEAIGKDGHVIGLDMIPEFLAYAKTSVKKSGFSQQVSFKEGSISKLSFGNDTFDWAWSADCVGYAPGDPLPLIKELVRVVKPGGIIAILTWSSQQLLPGYPQLEARLNTTASGIAPFVKGMKPEYHYFRLLGWFRKAGLEETCGKTFAESIYAPLSIEIQTGLISLIKMRWTNLKSALSKEDWEKYQRLTQPESPNFILNLPDYYAFFTYSLFCGNVAK